MATRADSLKVTNNKLYVQNKNMNVTVLGFRVIWGKGGDTMINRSHAPSPQRKKTRTHQLSLPRQTKTRNVRFLGPATCVAKSATCLCVRVCVCQNKAQATPPPPPAQKTNSGSSFYFPFEPNLRRVPSKNMACHWEQSSPRKHLAHRKAACQRGI